MKLSNWVKSFVRILFSIIFCLNVSANHDPVIISLKNKNDFYIKSKKDNTKVGSFLVSVFDTPKKCADGSLEFKMKIETEFNYSIKYDNREIENSENGKVFTVNIPKNELKNSRFSKKIKLTSENDDYVFQPIRLRIKPYVSISADARQVDFGRISMDGGVCYSSNNPVFKIQYDVLRDVTCEVKSKYNFRLKHKDKDVYLPYAINDLSENCDITLPADKNEYEAKCRLRSEEIKRLPFAGKYKDKITFTLKGL